MLAAYRHEAGSARGLSKTQRAATVLLAALLVSQAGCRLGVQNVIESPLSYDEQAREIRSIVPLGTSREQAVARLTEAGVQGRFGVSRSIYYCDLWQRDAGDYWHLDVALLFYDSGKLYRTRRAAAQISADADSQPKQGPSDPNVDTGEPAAAEGQSGR